MARRTVTGTPAGCTTRQVADTLHIDRTWLIEEQFVCGADPDPACIENVERSVILSASVPLPASEGTQAALSLFLLGTADDLGASGTGFPSPGTFSYGGSGGESHWRLTID